MRLKSGGHRIGRPRRWRAAYLTVSVFGLLSLLTVVVIASAGAIQLSSGGPAASRAVDPIRVRETEYRLRPSRVHTGHHRVKFIAVNNGTIDHALAVKTGHGVARTRVIPPGGKARLRVRLTHGRHVYFCPVDGHRQLGMRGVIRVG